MYFTKVKIENYGSIKKFEYNFRFNNNENPVPLIIVGQNGTGKTLLLANLVDALIEFKRDVYGEHIYETEKNKFFKIGSQSYIRAGESFSHVLVETKNQGKTYKYIDIMSKQPKEDVENGKINRADLKNANVFFDNGFSKKIIGGLKPNDYNKFIQLYFPSDRYYNPLWYAPRNKEELIVYEDDVTYPKSCLLKKNLVQEVKEWLKEVFLEKYLQQQLLPNDMSLPQQFRGQVVNILHLTPLQKIINDIFSKIKGVSSNVAENVTRKQKSVSIASNDSVCFDVSQLSQGEMNLFAIALSIVKEWDLISNDVDLNNIVGTVVIDEADLGLHIDYAYRALPTVMKMFPKVQFVLTAHSPFLLAGLENAFKDNLDIVSMPYGTIIKDVTDYFELKKAEEIVAKYLQQGEIEKEQIEKLQALLQSLDNKVNKIFIYTEGITDEIYLKETLKSTSFYSRIEFNPNIQEKDFGDSNLDARYSALQSISTGNIKICIFDRDNSKYIVDEEYISGANKTYKFSIPTPSFRSTTDKIAIEHYFKDNEITTEDKNGNRLFLAKEFDEQGVSIDDKYHCKYPVRVGTKDPLHIFDGRDENTKVYLRKQTKNLALPKKKFAEYVTGRADGFTFNMDEFALITSIIEKIVNDAETQEGTN